jgi:hypothetical protein
MRPGPGDVGTFGVPAREPPGPVPFMDAAEFLVARRVFAGCLPVPHFGKLSRGE